ncbi:hypothetical protein PIB30_023614 [Stylosanthes scabra]|uniref:Uncharacterized protein n=1 Tax=Stylosanthes scabra TaxID=79078 RepID=A0ABU6Z723_9FABA|nr:hypothetical protein [Stylosanthes scabra]
MAGQGRVQMIRDPDINRLDEEHHIVGAEEFQSSCTFAGLNFVATVPSKVPWLKYAPSSCKQVGAQYLEAWTPRCLATRGVVPTDPPPDCLVEYIQVAGFGGPL